MWCFPCGPSSCCPNKSDMPVFPAASLSTLCLPVLSFHINSCVISEFLNANFSISCFVQHSSCFDVSDHRCVQAMRLYKMKMNAMMPVVCIFSIPSTLLSTCRCTSCSFILYHFPVLWMAFVQRVLLPPSLIGFVNLSGTFWHTAEH